MSRANKVLCTVCGVLPVAMPRVDTCFGCWPGGPVVTPPCLRCGSGLHYFASGMCRRCHPSSIPPVESCRDCLAWGATRHQKWLCRGCMSWRRQPHNAVGTCRTCNAEVTLGPGQVCRLCRKQASMLRDNKQLLDLTGANTGGQQLFLADMFSVSARLRTPTGPVGPAGPVATTAGAGDSSLVVITPGSPGEVTGQGLKYRQLLLFEARRDLRAHGRTGLLERCDPALADHVDAVVADHARRHGWTRKATNQTQIGIRILLGLREHPDDLVKATDIVLLTAIDLGVTRVRELLADMGLLDDDRAPTVDRWFADHIADLPAPTRGELAIWFVIMRDGSTTPRRKPRTETTIAVQLRMAMPVLRAWAAAGITSLREVTRDDLTIALPTSGNARAGAGQALKSIFGVLKTRKVVFTNPAARVTTGWYQPHQPLPHDPAVLLQALTDPDPTRALIVALIAFHGLRMAAVRHLQLTDIRDRQLHQPDRTIPLAAPVITRLAAYLDDRAAAWPATLNPHLLVNSRSAWRDTPVGQRWVHLKIGEPLTAQSIREDRILLEAHATGGDTRALTDLFGLSITAATRYTDTVAHDGFTQLANPTR